MQNSSLRIRLVAGLALAFTLLASVGTARAADYDGNAWTTTGKLKFQVKKVGKNQGEVTATVSFTPTNFEIRGDDGNVLLTGSYIADPKGKAVLTPFPASLDSFLNNGIQEVLSASGYQGNVQNIAISKNSLTGKCKGSSKGIQLSLKMSIKADAALDISSPESMALDAGVSVSITLKGTIPPDISGTRWVGGGKSKISIKRFGSAGGAGTLDLTFGPAPGVPAGQFSMLSVEDGIRIVGPFTQSGTTVDMSGFAGEFAAFIEFVVEAETGFDVDVTVTSEKTTFKYKPGVSGKLSSKIKYFIDSDDTSETLTANVSISGKKLLAQ